MHLFPRGSPGGSGAFRKGKGIENLSLNDKEAPELFVIDPGEFLYMIKNAAYVLTNSFHAVAFSIKFNKEFYVFDRKENGVAGMFSRIETIAKLFGLENRVQNREGIVEQLPISNWMEIENKLVTRKRRV